MSAPAFNNFATGYAEACADCPGHDGDRAECCESVPPAKPYKRSFPPQVVSLNTEGKVILND